MTQAKAANAAAIRQKHSTASLCLLQMMAMTVDKNLDPVY